MIKLATFIVIVLASMMVSGYMADCEHGKSLKKIDTKVKRLKQHDRHQDYLERKRRIQRGK